MAWIRCPSGYVLDRVTEAEEVTVIGHGYDAWATKKSPVQMCTIRPNTDKGVDAKRGMGAGKTEYSEETCIRCETNMSKSVAKINIYHYSALLWLLGMTDRKELHPYFRQYRSHSFRPYNGNSLLQQTHPYTRLIDPCSDYAPNGINLSLYMCGTCFNKHKRAVGTQKQKTIEL